MKVILCQRVYKLGNVGQLVNVKPGFARNYLIPKSMARLATKENMAQFELERAELEKNAAKHLTELQARAASLEGVAISIVAQASEEGQLFGSVTALDISRALVSAGHPCAKSEVRLVNGALRQLGEHIVPIHLEGGELTANIKVSIVLA